MKPVFTTKMKCVVVSALISLTFVSQAFAVLRPLFPIKPAAPFNGELIVLGDDFGAAIHKEASDALLGPGTLASAWTAAYGLCYEGCPVRHYALAKISTQARRDARYALLSRTRQCDRNARAERSFRRA